MRVTLVYPRPDVEKQRRFGYSLTLLTLASLLRQQGCCVTYIDFTLENAPQEVLTRALPESTAVVIECDSFALKRSSNTAHAEQLFAAIKTQYPTMLTVALGADLALNPRAIAGCDYALPSGPEGLPRLVQTIVPSANVPLCYSLDEIPFPARDLVDHLTGGTQAPYGFLKKSAVLQASVGCGNNCAFCERKGWKRNTQRHSIAYLVQEFATLQSAGIKNVWIADDNFSFNLPWSKKVLQALIRQGYTKDMSLALSSWSKIDTEFLDLAYEAGVTTISMGVESANAEILAFYKKNINLDNVTHLVRYGEQKGLYMLGNFILGAPMESDNSIQSTLQYALNTPFSEVNMKILSYMRGSTLYAALPLALTQDRSHIMASQEEGLCDFPLGVLKKRITDFRERFRKERADYLRRKLLMFRPPYQLFRI